MSKFLLNPGFSLTLRPMAYPHYYEMYRDALKNTWSVDEVDFATDITDLAKVSPGEERMIKRLIAFFATGDNIVANNLVINLYNHVNAPEARMYYARQLFEEALHIEFYLTLLDTYLPDPEERAEAFKAVETIPSIRQKADFCFRWMGTVEGMSRLETQEDRRKFLLNLVCFATCVEGLFFFGAFAYVYFLRSRGLFHGLATGTNWVFRDESCHMNFAFAVIKDVRREEPSLWNEDMERKIMAMIDEAIECEVLFAKDALEAGVLGLSLEDMRLYLQHVGDQRLGQLGMKPIYHSKNPFPFMELQDVQELTNFFERRVAAYQTGIEGSVSFHEDF